MPVYNCDMFGELLRGYRVRAGLSQSDLAEEASMSSAAISALERGIRQAPYQSTISLLAKALHLTAEESIALKEARRTGREQS
jgi:transcriptional regulator with XRE-family HTH domain